MNVVARQGEINVPKLSIAIQTSSLRQPLKQALHTAARLGAGGVEIDARNELPPAGLSQTGLRQLRKLLDDLNLRVSAVAFPTRHGYDVVEDLDRRVAATMSAMRFAYQIGAEVVVNRVGMVPEDDADPRFGRLVETLTALGLYGERVGARLAAQTGSESGEQLARLISALPEGTVGADLYPSGLIVHGHDPEEAIGALGRWILHVHACDAVCDLALGRGVEVELGRGTADLPALLGGLEEFGYRGWVTIERRESANPVSEIANAVEFLHSL